MLMLTYNALRKPQMGTMQPARHKRDMHCRPLAPAPLPRSCTGSRDACDPGQPHSELLHPTQPMPRLACAGMSMPALPIMGADGTGHLQDLTSDLTACCCTVPLLRSPSSVEILPASTLFLVSMVAKSSPPASLFKRGRAACSNLLPQQRALEARRSRPTRRRLFLVPIACLSSVQRRLSGPRGRPHAPIRLSSMARSTLL